MRAVVVNVTLKLACAAVLMLLFWRACADEAIWPIERVNEDHPIGNTLGELVVNESNGYYQHEGLDVLAKPYPDQDAPFAVVTNGGAVTWVNMVIPNSTTNAEGGANYVRIASFDGNYVYVYHHLESAMLSLPLRLRFNSTQSGSWNDPASWPALESGDRIAQINEAFACDYNHLHYEVHRVDPLEGNELLNPLSRIENKPDAQAPSVKMYLARNDTGPWELFESSAAPGSCTSVSDDVDIIVEVKDRDDAGLVPGAAGNVGPYSLQWRACNVEAAECPWVDAHVYDRMEYEWTNPGSSPTKTNFSFVADLESVPEAWLKSGDACPENDGSRTFVVLTNYAPGGSWKTTSNRFPDGEYNVSVRAADLKGNEAIDTRLVCLKNE